MSSRGLRLAVPPEMQQNPCLELNNCDSSRVLHPKRIREYSLHVGDNSCRECHVGSKISGCFVFSALFAPMLQHRVAHHPSWNTAASLPSQSLYVHTCTSPPNNTFLKQYQPSTSKKAGNQHPCNNAD
ncbi:hypothetical protein GQ457_13G011940 [Hibiscus cannabinus]